MYTNHTHEVHFLENRYFQIEKLDWILLFLIQLQSNGIMRKDLQFPQGGKVVYIHLKKSSTNGYYISYM